MPIYPNKNSFSFSKKKECDNILKEWQSSFTSDKNRDQPFLNFKDEKEHIIKPTYVKEGLWLPSIGFTNALCVINIEWDYNNYQPWSDNKCQTS